MNKVLIIFVGVLIYIPQLAKATIPNTAQGRRIVTGLLREAGVPDARIDAVVSQIIAESKARNFTLKTSDKIIERAREIVPIEERAVPASAAVPETFATVSQRRVAEEARATTERDERRRMAKAATVVQAAARMKAAGRKAERLREERAAAEAAAAEAAARERAEEEAARVTAPTPNPDEIPRENKVMAGRVDRELNEDDLGPGATKAQLKAAAVNFGGTLGFGVKHFYQVIEVRKINDGGSLEVALVKTTHAFPSDKDYVKDPIATITRDSKAIIERRLGRPLQLGNQLLIKGLTRVGGAEQTQFVPEDDDWKFIVYP